MSEKKTRRRGDVLERAILDAAWEEALNVGFLKFTVEGVVKRAKTSRSVVYRRWNNKIELFEAAILHYFSENKPVAPNTSSLRDDLISLLTQISESKGHLMLAMTSQMLDFFNATETKPEDLREKIAINGQEVLETILLNAMKRGEISNRSLPNRVKFLPFDLLRSEFAMTLQPVNSDQITELVDVVVMPLFHYYHVMRSEY